MHESGEASISPQALFRGCWKEAGCTPLRALVAIPPPGNPDLYVWQAHKHLGACESRSDATRNQVEHYNEQLTISPVATAAR